MVVFNYIHIGPATTALFHELYCLQRAHLDFAQLIMSTRVDRQMLLGKRRNTQTKLLFAAPAPLHAERRIDTIVYHLGHHDIIPNTCLYIYRLVNITQIALPRRHTYQDGRLGL